MSENGRIFVTWSAFITALLVICSIGVGAGWNIASVAYEAKAASIIAQNNITDLKRHIDSSLSNSNNKLRLEIRDMFKQHEDHTNK